MLKALGLLQELQVEAINIVNLIKNITLLRPLEELKEGLTTLKERQLDKKLKFTKFKPFRSVYYMYINKDLRTKLKNSIKEV